MTTLVCNQVLLQFINKNNNKASDISLHHLGGVQYLLMVGRGAGVLVMVHTALVGDQGEGQHRQETLVLNHRERWMQCVQSGDVHVGIQT